MITALDTSVILDVITDDPSHAIRSLKAIRRASESGSIVICECVLAEVRPALTNEETEQLLADWNIVFKPSTKESSLHAGAMYQAYLKRNKRLGRVLPDFLIGAHAKLQCDRLLARDRGYYRDYFEGLELIEP
ncbi:MAG: type II toxin-antitoxin system VapC family toxin [Terrimicrobiaceae bacterium]